MRPRTTRWLLTLGLLPCLGCVGPGKLAITAYGERYIEQGIPDTVFADGFRARFAKFVVTFGSLTVKAEAGSEAQMREPVAIDLARPGPHLLTTFAELAAGRYEHVSVVTTAVHVEGDLATTQATWRFAWRFEQAARYVDCADARGGLGVVVPGGGQVTAQLTIHGDHLFYDDLKGGGSAALRGRAIADADLDRDGVVSLQELERIDLTTLPLGQYGTGGDGRVRTLGQFLAAQSRSLLHFQGEGECPRAP